MLWIGGALLVLAVGLLGGLYAASRLRTSAPGVEDAIRANTAEAEAAAGEDSAAVDASTSSTQGNLDGDAQAQISAVEALTGIGRDQD